MLNPACSNTLGDLRPNRKHRATPIWLQAQYKDYVTAIILRKNSITGTVYRDDPTILAWDIANEPSNPGDDSGDVLQVSTRRSLYNAPLFHDADDDVYNEYLQTHQRRAHGTATGQCLGTSLSVIFAVQSLRTQLMPFDAIGMVCWLRYVAFQDIKQFARCFCCVTGLGWVRYVTQPMLSLRVQFARRSCRMTGLVRCAVLSIKTESFLSGFFWVHGRLGWSWHQVM